MYVYYFSHRPSQILIYESCEPNISQFNKNVHSFDISYTLNMMEYEAFVNDSFIIT